MIRSGFEGSRPGQNSVQLCRRLNNYGTGSTIKIEATQTVRSRQNKTHGVHQQGQATKHSFTRRKNKKHDSLRDKIR